LKAEEPKAIDLCGKCGKPKLGHICTGMWLVCPASAELTLFCQTSQANEELTLAKGPEIVQICKKGPADGVKSKPTGEGGASMAITGKSTFHVPLISLEEKKSALSRYQPQWADEKNLCSRKLQSLGLLCENFIRHLDINDESEMDIHLDTVCCLTTKMYKHKYKLLSDLSMIQYFDLRLRRLWVWQGVD
jgi:hypothetical protein